MRGNKKTTGFDVHGNQQSLLSESKCFLQSKNLNCTSCHNPHQTERNDLTLLSTRCITCHPQNTQQFCSFKAKVGPTIVNNCIDCHMPAKPSKLIQLQTEKQSVQIANLVRSHLIDIYPAASQQYLKSVRTP